MADDRREALLVQNRISQLAEHPIRGPFDLNHLRAVHAHIFQDLPQHRPSEVRSDTSGWSKDRLLEGSNGVTRLVVLGTSSEENIMSSHDRTEISATPAVLGSPHVVLEQLVQDLAAKHPRLGLSFGYIGNCDFPGGQWDDRS